MFARFLLPRFLPMIMTILPISFGVSAGTGLSVHHGWIREAPPGTSVLAGYMVIKNDGAEPRRLIAAESPAFEAIELHRSVVRDGIASMIPQPSIVIPPAGGEVAFEPEGYHLMMMEPTRPLRAGSDVIVVLTFDGDERIRTTLPIKRALGKELHHHH